jgi:hypothetical protein
MNTYTIYRVSYPDPRRRHEGKTYSHALFRNLEHANSFSKHVGGKPPVPFDINLEYLQQLTAKNLLPEG